MVREAIIHAKWRSNIKTSHRILRKQSPLSPRNDQPTSLTIARQSYIYQASSFSFMNSINQLRNYISRKKQCVSLNPSQLSLDSVNCVYSCEEGVSSKKKKKKDRFSSIFLRISFPPEYSLSLSFLPSLASFLLLRSSVFLPLPFFFPSFNLFPLLPRSFFFWYFSLSQLDPSSCFFHSLTSKCFVRANFNENRVITREVQGTKGKTDARSKKKRVGDPR